MHYVNRIPLSASAQYIISSSVAVGSHHPELRKKKNRKTACKANDHQNAKSVLWWEPPTIARDLEY